MQAEIMEQFRILKGLTVRFGCLHEAQVQQLKVYPQLISGIKNSTAHVNSENRIVQFRCTGSNIRKTDKRLKEFGAITGWVRTLLWDNTVVVFEVNGKTLYDSTFDYEAGADSE